MTKFETWKREMENRYGGDEYKNDPDHQHVLGLIRSASALSERAQEEFLKAFDFDFALDGVVYVGTPKRAQISYPHLIAEAVAAGIKTVNR